MEYSMSNITQVADCEVLLNWAENEKSDLNFKLISEGRLTSKFATTSAEVAAILQGVKVELTAVETILNVLPDGPTKDDEQKKKVKLEYKKFLLETRKESYGAVALLEKQLDITRLQRQLDEVEAFINLVNTHKATL